MLNVSEVLRAEIWRDWQRLAAKVEGGAVFGSPVWHESLELSGVLEEGRSVVLAVTDEDALVAVVALRFAAGGIRFCGGTDLVDYQRLLCPAGLVEPVSRAIVRHLAGRRDWSSAHFASLPAKAPELVHLHKAFRAEGYSASIEEEDTCPVVELPDTWQAYLGALSKKPRHELRRKLRRVEDTGRARAHCARNGREVEAGLELFCQLQEHATPEKRTFWNASRRDFVQRAVLGLARLGQVRVHTLWVGATPIAVSLNFVQNDCWYAYNSAYHPGYRALSPGLVNHAEAIRRALCEGARRFDFLRGTEPYKYLLGARDQPLRALRIRRPA